MDQELGNVISKYPKKEIAKATNIRKKTTFAIQLVDNLFSASGPNKAVTSKPMLTKIKMIDSP